MMITQKMLYVVSFCFVFQMFTAVNAGAKKKDTTVAAKTTAKTTTKTTTKKSSTKKAGTTVDVAATVQETLKDPAESKNITFLKSFQLSHINALKDALIANNNAPFTILNAFIVQPFFVDVQYDITAQMQTYADAGLLGLPQDLRAFIGNQGTEPYMYVAKIVFSMGGQTYNLCYRNAFFSVPPLSGHQTDFDDMISAIAPYIVLPS
jgi:hypothetical protein